MSTTALAVPARWYTPPERIDVDGIPLAYRRSGSGPPVLFLHGHWLTRRLTAFHERLASTVDLVAPELPGFGETPLPDWLRCREDLTLFLRDVLDRLAMPRVHLVGYGLGAWFAADLASYFPDRMASLCVIAPYGMRVPGYPIPDYFAMNPADYADAYFNGAMEGFEDCVPGVGTPAQGGVEEFAHRYGELGAAARFVWSRRYAINLEWRLPRVAERGVRSLVVAAGADRMVPAGHIEAWARLLGAATVVVPDASHALLLQTPDTVADAVAAHVTTGATA